MNRSSGSRRQQPQNNAAVEQTANARPGEAGAGGAQAAPYEAPTMTTIGSARALTHGGFYNDDDSPGIRKTK